MSKSDTTIQNLALSVRQPYAELIMRGEKKKEFRSKVAHIRGRIYIYASKTIKSSEREAFRKIKKQPGDFPVGVLIGTVEITDCTETDIEFIWKLEKPKRLNPTIKPKNRAQPIWFKPFNK